MYSDKDINICFDCANAYAHKCEYILQGKPKRITKCPDFVPDYVAKGVGNILKYLGYSRYLYNKLGEKGLRKEAKKQGYRLEVQTNDNGRNSYYLRKMSDNNQL